MHHSSRFVSGLLGLVLLFGLSTTASAQTLELRSGEVIIGAVESIGDDVVSVRVGGADAAEIRRIATGDIAPQSHYGLLAGRADASDADAHQELADVATRIGLPLHAMAELREVARLAPDRGAAVKAQIQAIRESVAQTLVDEAKEQLLDHRYTSAKLNTEVVLQDYPETKVAAAAQKLMDEAVVKMRGNGDDAKPVGEKAIAKALEAAQRRQAAADKVGVSLTGGFRFTVKEKTKRERAVRHLEAAWKSVAKVVPDASVPPAAADAFTTTRESIRDTLGQHYLGLGSVLVQRFALPSAEDYNVKACSLDPNSGGCRDLQSLIIQARISNGIY
ncbi:MAG: hypothetical protein AAF628_15580 [Planctomycetota bacterium]